MSNISSGSFMEVFLKEAVGSNLDGKKSYCFSTNKFDLARNKMHSLDKLPMVLATMRLIGIKLYILREDGKIVSLGNYSSCDLVEMSKGDQSILNVIK